VALAAPPPATTWLHGLQLLPHVIDHLGVLPLRAEHDDLRVGRDLHVVPGGPVEQVGRLDRLPLAGRVRRGQLPAQDVAPVRALAEVAVQPLEQGRGVHSGGQREELAADLAQTGRISQSIYILVFII